MAPITITELLEQYGISLDGIDEGDISDGYHTYNELYEQRLYLFAALVNTFPDISWKSRKHEDGEIPFGGGWFVVGINTPKGAYTYHYEEKYWDLFKCPELPVAEHWDGHTAKDVVRVMSLEPNAVTRIVKKRYIDMDLSGIDYSNRVFYDCTFMNVNFKDANLSNTTFLKCNLGTVDFTDAKVDGITFVDTFKYDIKGVDENE